MGAATTGASATAAGGWPANASKVASAMRAEWETAARNINVSS